MMTFWKSYYSFQAEWGWIAMAVLLSPFILSIGVRKYSDAAFLVGASYALILVVWREIIVRNLKRKQNG